MLRFLFASALILAAVTACGPTPMQASPNISFAPTPYLPTLAPTPAGLATITPTPAPSNTPTETPTETEAPTSSAPPTDTPTITPTMVPHTSQIYLSDSALQPSQITLQGGQFQRVLITNNGTAEYDCQVQKLNLGAVSPGQLYVDESGAGNVPKDHLDMVVSDANDGSLHFFAMPKGTASLSFVPSPAGSYPLVCKVGGHQLTGAFVVQ